MMNNKKLINCGSSVNNKKTFKTNKIIKLNNI